MDKSYEEIHKIIVGTLETELGKKFLAHLENTFIDRPIYRQGQSLEETAYRQGQADLVKQLVKEMNNG